MLPRIFRYQDGPDPLASARARMVSDHLRARGITDERVLDVMGRLPRERFVPPEQAEAAYGDCAMGIGCRQTISQPYMVALMTEELGLRGGEKVLEIGTGSGYQTAVLAGLAGHVHTVERFAELSDAARRRLEELGLTNVTYHVGDGTRGVPAAAPFDRILVTAGGPDFPPPLVEQLAVGGRMLAPLGDQRAQMLTALDKLPGGRTHQTDLCGCVFVNLVGEHGWRE
jgi:protein-L-isoaspartate(D-aspartate) O-methyltransferase